MNQACNSQVHCRPNVLRQHHERQSTDANNWQLQRLAALNTGSSRDWYAVLVVKYLLLEMVDNQKERKVL